MVALAVTHVGGDIWAGNFIFGWLDTPIWDVLAPQEEQEQALNRLTTRPRSPAFQIRQPVPVGLALALFAAGLVGHGFSLN